MKTVSLIVAAAALAMSVPMAAQAGDAQSAGAGHPVSCLTYLSQFEGAVPYNPGAPRMAEAQNMAEKGRSFCVAGEDEMANAYLMVALREIGVTPKGVEETSPAIVERDTQRPLPGSADIVEQAGQPNPARNPELY